MNVHFSRRFDKQLDGIKNPDLIEQIRKAVEDTIRAKKPQDIPNIRQLRRNKKAYRIRIRDYRIGIIILGSEAGFMDIAHRKDIYRSFG